MYVRVKGTTCLPVKMVHMFGRITNNQMPVSVKCGPYDCQSKGVHEYVSLKEQCVCQVKRDRKNIWVIWLSC